MRSQFPLRLAIATATSAVALCVPTTSRAAEPDELRAWSERRLALHGIVSLVGGPTGNAGLELDYAPVKYLGFTAGVGTSWLLGLGEWTPRYALGARVRLPIDDAFALGAGPTVSTGRWAAQDYNDDDAGYWDKRLELEHALWVGAQVSFEWRVRGLSVKLMASWEVLTNGSAARCHGQIGVAPDATVPCSSLDLSLQPTRNFIAPVGVAVGYAF